MRDFFSYRSSSEYVHLYHISIDCFFQAYNSIVSAKIDRKLEIKLIPKLLSVYIVLHTPSHPGTISGCSPCHLYFPFYWEQCFYDRSKEQSRILYTCLLSLLKAKSHIFNIYILLYKSPLLDINTMSEDFPQSRKFS